MIEPPPLPAVEAAVRRALEEDRAFEDITTLATITPTLEGTAAFLAKTRGVACGLDVAHRAFHTVDPTVQFNRFIPEGGSFVDGDLLAEVAGPARALLQAERVALNFVQRLSGIATLTRAYVDAVSGTHASILDTRKTTPGLRDLEKYAVRCGGGTNHRRDLASMAMIKDNHREALARLEVSLPDAVAAIRTALAGQPVPEIEIEIDSLDDLDAALQAAPDWILLDNMSNTSMRGAVARTAGRAKLEASGGIALATVRAVAETGVDAISVGALTHSAPALDVSLEIRFQGHAHRDRYL